MSFRAEIIDKKKKFYTQISSVSTGLLSSLGLGTKIAGFFADHLSSCQTEINCEGRYHSVYTCIHLRGDPKYQHIA